MYRNTAEAGEGLPVRERKPWATPQVIVSELRATNGGGVFAAYEISFTHSGDHGTYGS